MTEARNKPGAVRDAIVAVFQSRKKVMTVAELRDAVTEHLGTEVPASSIRSSLNINTPGRFTRTARGRYKLSGRA